MRVGSVANMNHGESSAMTRATAEIMLAATSGSIRVGRDDLAATDGAQGSPGLPVDRVLDRLHAAVGEEGVDAAGMVAPRGDRGVGRAAVVLVLGAHVAIEGRGPAGDLVFGGKAVVKPS